MFETINITRNSNNSILKISFNRRQSRNALNSKLRNEIINAINSNYGSVRVIILTGAGGAFSIGHDFLEEPADDPEKVYEVLMTEYGPMVDAIETCPIPVIAAVNGPAIGVGVALALASDIVIMQQRSYFSLPFLARGMVPDAGVLRFLERRAGSQRALGAALFGNIITSDQALDWGLAWEVVPRLTFNDCIDRRAETLSALSPMAVRSLKLLSRGNAVMSPPEARKFEAELQAECIRSA
ncbi:enoyl-CoA hydratase/isomerase family protein [Loktanella sp. DJP18]|uniref:enoyl-CoA hydratase/isomerase family protein n=1 Tax=Loktanella sp. DJP18 TaxID=3409788 RepID=UPI003BB6BC52